MKTFEMTNPIIVGAGANHSAPLSHWFRTVGSVFHYTVLPLRPGLERVKSMSSTLAVARTEHFFVFIWIILVWQCLKFALASCRTKRGPDGTMKEEKIKQTQDVVSPTEQMILLNQSTVRNVFKTLKSCDKFSALFKSCFMKVFCPFFGCDSN